MRVGPSGTGCRTSPQSTRRCLGLRPLVVNGPGKGGRHTRQVRTRKANESEPLMTCRKHKDAIETRSRALVWDEVWGIPVYCPDGGRHKGGASLVQAFMQNVGTWHSDAKGDVQGAGTPRARVPMRSAGADCLVVAMRAGNAVLAKGASRPASGVGQPARGGTHV